MNTAMNYIGDVKITISRKSYKYRNSGHPKLFEYLARILSGQSHVISSVSPKYLTVSKTAGIVDASALLSIENIEVANSFKTTINGPGCLTTAVITQNNLVSQSGEITAAYLNLYNENNECLASAPIEAAIMKQIYSGRQALIEWTLRFSNKGE